MIKYITILLFIFVTNINAETLPSTEFKVVKEFINNMADKHNFNKRELITIFSQIRLQVPVIKSASKEPKKEKKIVKKSKPMTWNKYRSLFVNKQRIEDGVIFWEKYHKTINDAETKYSIPSEVIVAILGVETNYGKTKGKYPTLEALTKRAFGNYRRKNFYKNELESFLLMVRDNLIPPLSIKGSYAGAMGYPQFISSSYRHYAVDFNLDGKIDLFSNPIDSIGSIANYFHKHYWQKGALIATKVNLDEKHMVLAKKTTNKPVQTAKTWREKGLNIDDNIANETKIAYILLENEDESNNETWATFWNFYVVTRYNHDNRYAMAVFQLANKIKQKFNLTQSNNNETSIN
jgi:membrane-bound lytic murein transglycosylase B